MTVMGVTKESENILSELLEAVKSADSEAKKKAWAGVQDPDVLDTLADEWKRDSERISTMLSTIESVPGQVNKARNLRSAIKRLADERMQKIIESQVTMMEQEMLALCTMSAALGASAPPANVVEKSILDMLRVPRGYEIDVSGVYRLSAGMDGDVSRSRVAPAPIFISGRTIDVLTGEAKRQVVWRGPAGWCSRVIDRRTILDTSRIMSLADLEAPVSSNHISQVVSYLADFEAENNHRFPAVQSASRMGWLPDGGFLLPDKHYTIDKKPSSFALTAPPGLETISQGWQSKGSWADWRSAIENVLEYPYMMISIYASAAAPILEVLKLPGFVVDFSGETSGGKTTALRLAASVWGKPSDSYPTAMYSWDATKVWIERTTGYLHSLPLILDETKRVRHPRMIRDVIYDFCQGQGRGRGNPDGTRRIDSWRTVLISSGEGAATSFSQDAGTRARVLSLKGKPLGDDPKAGGKMSENLQVDLAGTYGHLGRRIIEYLVSNHKNYDRIREVFRNSRDGYAAIAKTAVARRHAAHLAVLEVAASIVHQLGVPKPVEDPFAHLIESAFAAGEDADRPLAAMQDLVSWCAANQSKFYGRHDTSSMGIARVPNSGWGGSWSGKDDWDYIAVTALTIREVLKELGYHPEELLTRWDEREWLYRGRGRNRTRVVRVDGVSIRCYCIKRSTADLALED
jgi:hypothetical protein|tara:strand:- start:2297 stop:4360 length:2064 start_codon:yes stop_codon:yes gene_type:complete